MVEIRQTPPTQTVRSEHLVSNDSRTAAVGAPSPEPRPAKDVVVFGLQGDELGKFRSLLGGRSTPRTTTP